MKAFPIGFVYPRPAAGTLHFGMPELPEVETIRRQLAPYVAGQRVLVAHVHHPRATRAHASSAAFIALVTGRTILEAQRRGKALLFPLDGERTLLVRLGMSGRLLLVSPETPVAAHTHVVLELAGAMELRYVDPRTFGQVAVVDGHDPADMIELGHYGVEPLSDAFTVDVLRAALAGKSTLIQAVLMDQTKIAGIGKIYADEACFQAGIHPVRTAGSVTTAEAVRLHAAIRDVLTRAIAARGTSSLDAAYRDAAGNEGGFQHQLHVYQQVGRPCRACGTLIEYRPFQGRRMHFCPRCQH